MGFFGDNISGIKELIPIDISGKKSFDLKSYFKNYINLCSFGNLVILKIFIKLNLPQVVSYLCKLFNVSEEYLNFIPCLNNKNVILGKRNGDEYSPSYNDDSDNKNDDKDNESNNQNKKGNEDDLDKHNHKDNESNNKQNKKDDESLENLLELVLDVVNLITVCAKLNISRQDLEKFELEHKERDDLNEIKEDIKKHHEIFSQNLLNMNLSTAKNIIRRAFINLKEDENNLKNFIKEIKQKIEKKTKDRNLSIGNFACNAGHLIYRGCQLMRGGSPLLILNLVICLVSTGVSGYDIVIQQKHINLLSKLYEEAVDEKENLKKILDKLLQECNELKKCF